MYKPFPFLLLLCLCFCVFTVMAQDQSPVFISANPNSFEFSPVQIQYIRVLFHDSFDGDAVCVDELEVYGPDSTINLASAAEGARATASSTISGYPSHNVAHLNDGKYGNAFSWIPSKAQEEWAQIKLREPMTVGQIVLSRDRNRQFGDRLPHAFDILVSMNGVNWEIIRSVIVNPMSSIHHSTVPTLPGAPPPPSGESVIILTGLNAGSADNIGSPNLALRPEAIASASSVYANGALPVHQIRHLNDGKLGNSYSWISAGEPSWAQIDLGAEYWVHRVALGNDSSQQHQDRAVTDYAILTATQYATDSNDPAWQIAWETGGTPLQMRREITFAPVKARYVRVLLHRNSGGEARIDELEVFGQEIPVALADLGSLTPSLKAKATDWNSLLRLSFVGEEHALLKTFGRADLDPSLVPYNGLVKEYPRHVENDILPLPTLPQAPKLDGATDDSAWQFASQGTGRVALPDDFDKGPLTECTVSAGRFDDQLYFKLDLTRLLSSHLAVISAGDWSGWGILTYDGKTLRFNRWQQNKANVLEIAQSLPVDGFISADGLHSVFRLPVSIFKNLETDGLRVGLGMGGLHVPASGQAVTFFPSPLSVAQAGPCLNGNFPVRFTLGKTASAPLQLSGSASELADDITLQPGENRVVQLKAEDGPIGPQLNLKLTISGSGQYQLGLFRYTPLARVTTQMRGLIKRLEAKGVDVSGAQTQLEQLRQQEKDLLAALPDAAKEREIYFTARKAQRDLFMHDPDLKPLGSLLFGKRNPYHPSHIYTDYTDAPFRPGGGIYTLSIPWDNGYLEPENASLTMLYDGSQGIARDPVADYDLNRIYFGYRPSADGFYHIMSMDNGGGDLQQLTAGPYHDFYPCPLPDGGLAFISTRCTARVFCFRGGSSTLFRMEPDGSQMRPLSFASLSEWAPSVMKDGRIIWTRWEYIDKGADFTQTLWAIRPDGTQPEAVFGNTILQPNGYANGREVPGTTEISCTLVSHFGDINGPIALVDPKQGPFNPEAITSLTPEVPWPGMWPARECFRDPVPIARDLFLCAHAPADRFGLYVIDRFGNRELLYVDPTIDSVGATLYRPASLPPVMPDMTAPEKSEGEFIMTDVSRGLEDAVGQGKVRWLRVVEEVPHSIVQEPNKDHVDFMKWYASPVDVVSGPYGWPTYVAKRPLGLVPVREDGSTRFKAPAGKVIYFQALDENFNELQRMRSVVQLQPGETRSCVGCHESRLSAAPVRRVQAASTPAERIKPHVFGAEAFSYERIVQPVWDRNCIQCHETGNASGIDLTGKLDAHKVPASYRTLIERGLVNYLDCGWNSGGCEKAEAMTFGTVKSPLWTLLDAGHHHVALNLDEKLAIKTWTDLNCPLWPDYQLRDTRSDMVAETEFPYIAAR